MIIAIDYEKVFVQDPHLWLSFIKAASAKHEVYCVTMRNYPEDEENTDVYKHLGGVVPILWTEGVGKKSAFAQENIRVNVWIDGKPETILGPTSSTDKE
jgi:hypothetical protein